MDNSTNQNTNTLSARIISLDFFRGITMFLLMGESTHLYHFLTSNESGMVIQAIGTQLTHHEWHGLYFWDLVQPFFMFIVGAAIPMSVNSRIKRGDSDKSILMHAIKRSLLLLFFGWALYCIGPGHIVFRFQNVLAQLSVTYMIAFLIWKKSVTFQLIFSFMLILLTDLAYRFFPVEGFDQPWVAYHNLGTWTNNMIEGTSKTSIWASINAIPTTAHTIWGVLCGQLLINNYSATKKIKLLVVAGFLGLLIGYSLDLFGVTPIIKKIATSSFVFVSGGWTILALCFCYWLIDIRKVGVRESRFFTIVGMNSIFIYIFFEVGGADLINRMFIPFTRALFGWSTEHVVNIMTSLSVWAFLWYICYWLYKNRVFIKI